MSAYRTIKDIQRDAVVRTTDDMGDVTTESRDYTLHIYCKSDFSFSGKLIRMEEKSGFLVLQENEAPTIPIYVILTEIQAIRVEWL